MSELPIQNVTFVGAGTMGCANSLHAALAGFKVSLFDINQEALNAAAQRQRQIGAWLTAARLCTNDDIEAAINKIHLEPDLTQAYQRADLVSESVLEQLPIKRNVHAQLDLICPPKTLLTTNSSGLLVSEIEDVVARGKQFAALHTHLGSPLVDVVGGPRTAKSTIDILCEYAKRCGGVPLVSREYPSYLLNGMIGSLVNTAIALAASGEADFADIDHAWMKQVSAVSGPFGMMDMFGLDVVYDSWQKPMAEDVEALRAIAVPFLETYVKQGQLGLKTGAGFYNYPEGMPAPEKTNETLADILMTAVMQKALIILHADVASAADIDLAWTVGMNLNEGPLTRLKRTGVQTFFKTLDHYCAAGFLHCPDRKTISKTAAGV